MSEVWKGSVRPLRDRAVFRITGPDRVRYLNGQVSNDVAGPLDEMAVAACVCSLKGKVEFLVWIHARGDALWLDAQREQAEALHERLDRYLIADDCEIENVTDQGLLIHHFLPDLDGVSSKRASEPGKDLWIPDSADVPLPEKEISEEDFERIQVEAGIPRAPEEISGNEFPAELGIESWAVDFRKGCYLGQEVISRIQSVGRVKRRLYRVVASIPFERESKLRTAEGAELLSTRASIPDSDRNHIALAWGKSGLKASQAVDVERIKE